MTPDAAPIDPALLPERVSALPGVSSLREAVSASGANAYLVGGAVRDVLLGADRADLDVVVEGDPLQLASELAGPQRAHDRFGTVTAVMDDVRVDLVTARRERYAHPGALPEVEPADLADDLSRRDFSLNAMAVPLHREVELIDPHGGLDDLRSSRLRVLHEASFIDDPTRALRAARYAARLAFSLEADTERLLRAAELETVSEDRIEAELLKLAAEPTARRGFELLDEWGLIALEAGAGEVIAEVIQLLAVDPWRSVAERALVAYAAATGRGPGPVGRRRDLREGARELVEAAPARPSDAVALASGRSDVELALARAMSANWLDDYVSSWRRVKLEISGEDLMSEGVPEGPAVGRGLAAALRAKLDGEISGREAELEVAVAAAREAGP
jgi:tRNA nucleotidyltransferase (CCA-adding enzyme)